MKKIVILICCFFTLALYGQDKKYFHSYSVVANNFINPGISYKITLETDRSHPFVGYFAPQRSTFYPSVVFTTYWDPFSHVGFQNYLNLEYDLVLYRRLRVDYGVGVGYQSNFTTDNYVVNDDFEVKKRALFATVYGLGNVFLGFRIKNDITERSSFIRANLFFLTPYNNGVLPSILISTGKTF